MGADGGPEGPQSVDQRPNGGLSNGSSPVQVWMRGRGALVGPQGVGLRRWGRSLPATLAGSASNGGDHGADADKDGAAAAIGGRVEQRAGAHPPLRAARSPPWAQHGQHVRC